MSKVLNVPYYTQPDSVHCQSACLKMFVHYILKSVEKSHEAGAYSIYEIKKSINESKYRPDKTFKNSHTNMIWWLNQKCPPYKFEKFWSKRELDCEIYIKYHLDRGFPIIASTSHSNFKSSHVILIIGYKTNRESEVEYICHDPYGKFNPYANSSQYGDKRFEGGMSLPANGEIGPGKGVIYGSSGVKRARSSDKNKGWHYLISVKV